MTTPAHANPGSGAAVGKGRGLPGFVVIGAMKAGTTSLHAYLAAHPAICMSSRKDTNFFAGLDNWRNGFDWYASLFADRSKLVGETSAGYSQHPTIPHVPERVAEANPEARVIYLVRDPIRRIMSHFAHNVAQGRERQSLDEAFVDLDRNHYVNTSRYHLQVSRWLERFDRRNILLVSSESLQDDRPAALRRIFEFLGVDAAFESPFFDRTLHRTADLRQRTALGRAMARVPVIGRLGAAMPFARRAVRLAPMSPSLERRIAAALQPDVEALKALAGDRFEEWTTYAHALSSETHHPEAGGSP